MRMVAVQWPRQGPKPQTLNDSPCLLSAMRVPKPFTLNSKPLNMGQVGKRVEALKPGRALANGMGFRGLSALGIAGFRLSGLRV